MDKIMKKIKEIFYDKKIYIFAVVTMMFFGIFCKVQYAPDTYFVFTNSVLLSVAHFFSCGRYITGLVTGFLIGILHLSNTKIYYVSYLFAILFMVISIYKLDKLIEKRVKNKFVSAIIAVITLINPFILELYFYIEKGIMILSILMCVLAVEQIDKFFQGKKIAILWAFIYMLIANCCYQGTVGAFVSISVILILEYSKNIKDFIKNNIIVALVYGIPAVINFLSIKLLYSNVRINGNINFVETIKKVVEGSEKMLVNTYSILPKYVFLAVVTFLVIYIFSKIIINKKMDIKKKLLLLAGTLYLVGGAYVATIAPQMLQATSSIWFVARSSYPMGIIIGTLMLYLWKEFAISNVEENIVLVIITIFSIIQVISFIHWGIDNYIGNYEDKIISKHILEQVEKYEKETGNIVDSVAIYQDSAVQYKYEDLKCEGDMNIKAFFPDWCVTRILSLYSQKDWKKVEPEKERQEKFSTKNWNEFSDEQIEFEQNVMHLCIY